MRKSTRMMLMTGRENYGRDNGQEMRRAGMYRPRMGGEERYGMDEYNTNRNEYNGAGMNYGIEGRFRDRRGRTHYNNGKFAPMRSEMDEEEWDDGKEYPSPIWEKKLMPGFYGESGFRSEGESMPGGEMSRQTPRKTSEVDFTPEMAKEWTKGLSNEDGSKGPHWPFDQAKQIMNRRGIVCDPYMFWAVINALYSDYCAVTKKHGINGVDFYADLAAAWLNDKDAKDNKAALYYECITK